MDKKYIIGLGCSWTQGEGGYPEHIWQEYKGHVQIRSGPDTHLRVYEHENSWVNVLCRDHFTEYTPVNLGVRGIGNSAAVKQLNFSTVDFSNSTGYVILMLSGLDRFDFFAREPRNYGYTTFNDGYSNGEYIHYKWRAMWPNLSGDAGSKQLWDYYAREMFSEEFAASEAMMTLIDVQNFCRLHGYKLIVANAFNQHPEGIHKYLSKYTGSLSEKFDWSQFVHEHTEDICMIQKLIRLDGIIEGKHWTNYYQTYLNLPYPQRYLTNCIHPNIDGYKVIAAEIAEFMRDN